MGDAALPQWGSSATHNLEVVLNTNVVESRYFASLHTFEFDALVDEIYNAVTHVEPWMSGGARGPSTAFCILKRLCVLGLSPRNIRTLLSHPDSPFIRAVRAS